MPTFRHEYSFNCVACGCYTKTYISEEDFKSGRVNPNDITAHFQLAASLDFSKARTELIYDSAGKSRDGLKKDMTGDLCDQCFESLISWWEKGVQ